MFYLSAYLSSFHLFRFASSLFLFPSPIPIHSSFLHFIPFHLFFLKSLIPLLILPKHIVHFITIPVLHSDGVEEAVVDDKPELAIWAFDEHSRSDGSRLGVADETVGQVRLDVLLHGN